MNTDELHVVSDVSQGEWLAPRLSGAFGAVGLTVPRGFSAYARIFHPATNTAGERVRWAEVARATGRQAHALMQWDSIARSANPAEGAGSSWEGTDPSQGNLDCFALAALCDRLTDEHSRENGCYFCLWEGYGELETYGWLEQPWVPGSKVARGKQHRFTLDELSRPRLRLPDRGYLVLRGPLRCALQIGSFGAESFWSQSPNLFWPVAQTWCVASEIDFDSTLVGGSNALIAAILGAPDIEAWPVEPDDSLAHDADKVNQPETGRHHQEQQRR